MSSIGMIAVWVIAAASVFGMLVRPRNTPEWLWAAGGAVAIVVTGQLPLRAALSGVARGADVYAFLAGILTLAELARAARLFDWVAVRMLRLAGGSPMRLLFLVYGAGVAVTALLSNDTTVVVLTPAVLAALKRTNADPLPHLFACAFVANAASFLLPISNPANLVLFGSGLPALAPWIAAFGLAAAAAVVLTYAVLMLAERSALRATYASDDGEIDLPPGAALVAALLAAAALALVIAAWHGVNVGYTAAAAATVAALVAFSISRDLAGRALRSVEWSVILLVAGLFGVVTALDRAGAIAVTRDLLHRADTLGGASGHLLAAIATTLAANAFNNLPVGLVAGFAIQSARLTPALAHAVLVAVDLGPNLSVTGSLATLLWLIVIRREGIEVSAGRFFRLGAAVLAPALLAALLLVR